MNREGQYKRSHRAAKVIVCTTVIILLVLGEHYNIPYIEASAVVVWFFGVNPVGYFIEKVLHFHHKHSKF